MIFEDQCILLHILQLRFAHIGPTKQLQHQHAIKAFVGQTTDPQSQGCHFFAFVGVYPVDPVADPEMHWSRDALSASAREIDPKGQLSWSIARLNHLASWIKSSWYQYPTKPRCAGAFGDATFLQGEVEHLTHRYRAKVGQPNLTRFLTPFTRWVMVGHVYVLMVVWKT